MIVVSTLVSLFINFLGVNPISALFWAAVINGFLAPPLLLVIMLIANNRSVMGSKINSVGLNVLGWATAVLMAAVAVALVLAWIR